VSTGGNRRAPGQVRDAIVRVLESRSRARVGEIHQEVEKVLGGPVPKSSVRSYLQIGTDATPPLFQRVAHGVYRLARRK
jgi:hypothetical protein